MPLCEQLHRLDFDNAEIVTARIGAAGLVTEFGATDDLSVLESITRLADEYLVGWMYWHYKNWGDPTTVSGETGAQGLFSQDSDLTTLKSGTSTKINFRPRNNVLAAGWAEDATSQNVNFKNPHSGTFAAGTPVGGALLSRRGCRLSTARAHL